MTASEEPIPLKKGTYKLLDVLACLGLSAQNYFSNGSTTQEECTRLRKDIKRAYSEISTKLHRNNMNFLPLPLQKPLGEFGQIIMQELQNWKRDLDAATPEELQEYVTKLNGWEGKRTVVPIRPLPLITFRENLEKIIDGIPIPGEKTEAIEKLLAQTQTANRELQEEYDLALAALKKSEKQYAAERKKSIGLEKKYIGKEAELAAEKKKNVQRELTIDELTKKYDDVRKELAELKRKPSPSAPRSLRTTIAAGILGIAAGIGITTAHFLQKPYTVESRAYNSNQWAEFAPNAAEARVRFTDGQSVRFNPSIYLAVNNVLAQEQGRTLLLDAARKDGDSKAVTYQELAESHLLNK